MIGATASSCVRPTADVRPEIVNAIMKRVGVDLPPEQFVHAVACAYAAVAPTRGAARLELQHSDPVFQESIRRSRASQSALMLRCGNGLCGFDPSYARREFLDIWPSVSDIEECAVTAPLLWDESLWPRRQFDTVVAYLMAHYISDIHLIFELIQRVVRPGGAVVMMAHNARFWQIEELRRAADDVRMTLRRNARLRRYFDVGLWMSRVRRVFRRDDSPDLRTRVNQVLARRFELAAELTSPEIVHLVDIHRPTHEGDPLQVGMNGFDVQHLTRNYLSGFSLEFYQTRGWAGYVSDEQLPPALREHVDQLARRYPDDGLFFSACWRRSA